LNDLRRADAGSQAVFGDWVPELLRKIECTNFSGPKPKGPLGKSDFKRVRKEKLIFFF